MPLKSMIPSGRRRTRSTAMTASNSVASTSERVAARRFRTWPVKMNGDSHTSVLGLTRATRMPQQGSVAEAPSNLHRCSQDDHPRVVDLVKARERGFVCPRSVRVELHVRLNPLPGLVGAGLEAPPLLRRPAPAALGPPTKLRGPALEQNPRGSLGRTAVGNELARLCKINPCACQDH